MTQIRLLPIVVVAASALLALKTIGLVSGSGYILGGIDAVVAQEAAPQDLTPEQQAAQSEQMAAAEAAAEALFSSVPSQTAAAETELWQLDGSGEQSRVITQGNQTGDVLLQRLAERRAELDAIAAELETRLAVVEAAELRIEERMVELNALEAQITAQLDSQDAAEAEQFMAIVSMYEAMRAGDAGTILNDLDMDVLVRLGHAMNPRKLGPIMAKMNPGKAQELTVLLARNDPPAPQSDAPDLASLPQIVGQ